MEDKREKQDWAAGKVGLGCELSERHSGLWGDLGVDRPCRVVLS